MSELFDISQFIFKYDNLLSDFECEYLISQCNDGFFTKEHSLEVYSQIIKNSTVDVLKLQPKTKAFKIAHEKTNFLIRKYYQYLKKFNLFNTSKMMLCFSHSHRYRLMKYSEGQSIHLHDDKNYYTFGSASLCLNDNYEGGNFCFFNGKYEVKYKKGCGIIFPAETYFSHEVKKVTKGTRYSVNSFLGTEDCVEDRESSNFYFHPCTTMFLNLGYGTGTTS